MLNADDVVRYTLGRKTAPKYESLAFAVIIEPWMVGNTHKPVRGFDYGDVVLANRETREILYAWGASNPTRAGMGGFTGGVPMGGPRHLGPGGKYRGVKRPAHEVITGFDDEAECAEWFEDFEAAERRATEMKQTANWMPYNER
ncbi:hypothetical protein ACFV6F_17600 [Kitasatospora phosalacinea]|uniref:hypothetical protein n=1 Tax=Kitasatospora phosalacinea TaxID=2065 RepID=UPI003648EC9F